MASSGSRKRRHKSKEKWHGTSSSKEAESQESQQKQKHQKHQEKQQLHHHKQQQQQQQSQTQQSQKQEQQQDLQQTINHKQQRQQSHNQQSQQQPQQPQPQLQQHQHQPQQQQQQLPQHQQPQQRQIQQQQHQQQSQQPQLQALQSQQQQQQDSQQHKQQPQQHHKQHQQQCQHDPQQHHQPFQQHQKQQQPQQTHPPSQNHQLQPHHHPAHHQQPQHHQQQQGKAENAQSNGQPLLTCILDRLFLARQTDMASVEQHGDGSQIEGATCSTVTTPTGHTAAQKPMEDQTESISHVTGDRPWKHQSQADVLSQKEIADVAGRVEAGHSNLMMAAYSGDVAMMALLWSYGGSTVDVNAGDKEGNTALHICTFGSCKDGMSFLMDRGADPAISNNHGKSPLHIAASQGNIGVCELLLERLIPAVGEVPGGGRRILYEDAEGKTPVCEAVVNQHLTVLKLLLDACSPQEALEYYLKNIQKLSNLPVNDPTVDIQPVLASLLFVIKRLQQDYLREMAEVNPMQYLVHVIRRITSPRVLSTACLVVSILVWKDSTDTDTAIQDEASRELADSEFHDIQDSLMHQFLECRGADAVLEKLSAQLFTAHDTYLIVSTLLPVMILATRESGRAWLEQNSGNLSFYKEMLTRNKAFITHISLNNQPGLQVGNVIKTFLSFVEETEAKDREQNLAQLLEEEERDRLKRERKKRKRQKKHNKHAKAEVAVATDVDVSTDDESGECAGWDAESCRGSEIFSNLGDAPPEKDQSHLYYSSKYNRQLDQHADQDDQYAMPHGSRQTVVVPGKSHPSEACIVSDKFADHDAKWRQPVSLPDEFPPISVESDERTCSDAGEGWVKVEGRKQGIKTVSRHSNDSLVSRPVKKQEVPRPAPMRWADVAKIGCCRDSGSRNFTVLLANTGRYPVPEYCKMPTLSRTSTAQSMPELADPRNAADVEGDDWQQIARNAFADNMASKETDDEQDILIQSPASSGSESDVLSSTLSSECPSGQSDGLHGRKKTAIEDFDRSDVTGAKELCSNKSDHYKFNSSFPTFHVDPREIKSFIFPDESHLEDKSFLADRCKSGPQKKPLCSEVVRAGEEKLPETAWSRAEAKPAMAFSQIWRLATRAKSLVVLDDTSTDRATPLQCGDCHDDQFGLSNFTRPKTPPACACAEALPSMPFPSAYPPDVYYDVEQDAPYLRGSKETANKPTPHFTRAFQKNEESAEQSSSNWCYDKQRHVIDYNTEQYSWRCGREAKPVDCTPSTGWCDVINVETNSASSQQQVISAFMPSFASMSSAVDNNPIVTSVVESVLTPSSASLSSHGQQNQAPTYGRTDSDMPSPPPGFKLHKPSSQRHPNFDQAQATGGNPAVKKNGNPPVCTVVPSQEMSLQAPAFSGRESLNLESLMLADKQLLFDSLKPRSTMAGVHCSKLLAASEDSLQSQQQQQQLHQRQYFQTITGALLKPFAAGSSQRVHGADSRPPGGGQTVFEVPMSCSNLMSAEQGADNWADRFRSLALSAGSTASNLLQPQYPSSSNGPTASNLLQPQYPSSSNGPTASNLLQPQFMPNSNVACIEDFTTILSGRLQQRQTLRHQDNQQPQLKRQQQQYQTNKAKSFQETTENGQRRYSEQNLTQPQTQQMYYTPATMQPSCRLNLKQNKHTTANVQQKQPVSVPQHLSRPKQQQQRLPSPPVLFPGDLRDEPDFHVGEKPNSPVFQDMAGNDLLSDLFADPLLVERIAVNQIRQQVLTSQANSMLRDSATSALRDSVYCNDLEYYASLYRLKLKDLLMGATQSEPANSEPGHMMDRSCGLIGRPDLDKPCLINARNPVDGRRLSPKRESGGDRFSRRWREPLNKILDTAWTTRRQYGDIVLPKSLSDFNISQVEYPLVLGFTSDGCEVAVLILEKSRAYIDPYLLDIMCDPELDHHFILKCKGMSETCSTEYVALDLCDYTLAEYMQIVQLSHRQDPLSANRLAWQLLEGLKFIHHNLSMPHGNLKPSWIFVDAEGRLRLAGYGIVTKQSGEPPGNMASGADRSESERSLCWMATEDLNNDQAQPSMASDIQVAGMLLYYILTGGQHPFGTTILESDGSVVRNLAHMDLISDEANDLVSGMLFPDPGARPTVEHCLRHPFFWSSEKKFRLILIVGSDVLTEMKTGIALTGNGSPTMTEILSVLDISDVSPNWVQSINPTVMKEMRSFRVYKNSLSELTLFIYNCCLHFDKMSGIAKEMLDDPCKYFQSLFPSLFMAIFRCLKASDRTDRTCYKPFFS